MAQALAGDTFREKRSFSRYSEADFALRPAPAPASPLRHYGATRYGATALSVVVDPHASSVRFGESGVPVPGGAAGPRGAATGGPTSTPTPTPTPTPMPAPCHERTPPGPSAPVPVAVPVLARIRAPVLVLARVRPWPRGPTTAPRVPVAGPRVIIDGAAPSGANGSHRRSMYRVASHAQRRGAIGTGWIATLRRGRCWPLRLRKSLLAFTRRLISDWRPRRHPLQRQRQHRRRHQRRCHAHTTPGPSAPLPLAMMRAPVPQFRGPITVSRVPVAGPRVVTGGAIPPIADVSHRRGMRHVATCARTRRGFSTV